MGKTSDAAILIYTVEILQLSERFENYISENLSVAK